MKYELAKQLKEAGFPQEEKDHTGQAWVDEREDSFGHPTGDENEFLVPPLAQLIEACREDRFLSLELICPEKGKWGASTKTHECDCARCKKLLKDNPEQLAVNWEYAEGTSPEEVVAKLWLQIQARKK